MYDQIAQYSTNTSNAVVRYNIFWSCVIYFFSNEIRQLAIVFVIIDLKKCSNWNLI